MRSGRFSRVLRLPGVPGLLLAYTCSRLASTMLLLSVLLYAEHETGSFARAGAVTAALAVGCALAAPFLGRLVDRRGRWVVLSTCALLQPVLLVGTMLWLQNAHVGAAMGTAALAGAFLPPVTSCMRAVWPALVPDDELTDTAWSLESVVVEATELGGPLTAGAVVLLAGPTGAVLTAAALVYVGAMAFGVLAGSLGEERSTAPRTRGRLVRTAPIGSMLVLIAVTSAGIAATEVALAARAVEDGSTGRSGFYIALWLVGSLAGGLWYGARTWRSDSTVLLPRLMLAGAALIALPALAGPLALLVPALLVAGLLVAPATAAQFAIMSRIAPGERRTECFTWASTAGFLGVAAGNWVAGWAVHQGGTGAAWAVSGGAGALAALLAVVCAGVWTPTPVALPRQQSRRAPRRTDAPATAAS